MNEAEELYEMYGVLKEKLADKIKDDPNVMTIALTNYNMQFSSKYPIVIKHMAVTGLFYVVAFNRFLDYLVQNTMESLMGEYYEEHDIGEKPSPAEKLEAKLRARSRQDAEYIFQVERSHRNHFQTPVRQNKAAIKRAEEEYIEQIAEKQYQELLVQNQQNEETIELVREQERLVEEGNRKHILEWSKCFLASGGETFINNLQHPQSLNTSMSEWMGDIVE
jgi:hypothetical protein